MGRLPPFISVRPRRGLQPLICRLSTLGCSRLVMGLGLVGVFHWAGLELKPGSSWPKGIHQQLLLEHPCTLLPLRPCYGL